MIGKKVPDFTAEATAGPFTLSEYRGHPVVLYFYPKADTPGCTQQACAVRDVYPQIEAQNAVVIGISPDSEASHARFIEKHSLTMELLSDPDKQVCNLYGVWQKKKMAGKEYMGVVRTTFLIDPKGKIARVWEKVRVDGHADEVLQSCCDLS